MDYQFLDKIKSPDDVKSIPDDELYVLCGEIRDCLIKTVSHNGGHLASNLGIVELSVALHKVFDSPKDTIIFDVGHQCYTHKLLTGRYNEFSTIRTEDGISGFMKPSESDHDPVITGHSSTSISSAYGFYKAKELLDDDSFTVAVIGDGAMTGGMVYEALNNSGTAKKNFIVILNDNKMSISRNVGAFARYLNVVRSTKGYHRLKFHTLNFLEHLPLLGKFIKRNLLRSKLMIKNAIYHTNIFEGFGFHYLGPVDGHNTDKLINMLKIAKTKNHPVLIHVVTTKGKGYDFAESKPKDYHGVGPFNVNEGTIKSKKEDFSQVFGDTLFSLAENDERICAVTAAMTEGTGLSQFSSHFKERFFDVGIAEQHAVTFSAALAAKGMKPYFAVYSSFLQRGYDQIIHDAAIAGVPMVLCVDRAGFVGEDGETHHGLFDAAFLSGIPGIDVYSPSYYSELCDLLNLTANQRKLTAIRYPRGAELDNDNDSLNFTGSYTLVDNFADTLIITYGRIFANALAASEKLSEQGKRVSILKLNRIHPIDNDVVKIVECYKNIFFFEEGIKAGSIGQQVAEMLLEKGINTINFKHFAVDNTFVKAASVSKQLEKYKLDADSMFKIVSEVT